MVVEGAMSLLKICQLSESLCVYVLISECQINGSLGMLVAHW